jgi:phospho-N-acetylmuramoyl-pentapeptide-transferase
MIGDVIKVFGPSALSFFIGIVLTPFITHFLYQHQAWKKKAGKIGMDGEHAVIFSELHKDKEVGTPRLGGVVIWASVLCTTFLLWIIALFFDAPIFEKLDFLSRSQTWIPLAALFLGALIGMADDLMEIYSIKGHHSGGMSLKKRLFLVASAGLLCGLWFYNKLDVSGVGLPFGGEIYLGWVLVPLFAVVMLIVYSGGVIDGIDGLSGGVFAVIFSTYAGIAFAQNQLDLAALCAVIVGGTLAFLWFNIPPARFYMSETGSMALTVTLTVVAFMTDSLGGGYGLLVLPVVAMPLMVTTLSVIIQVLSKKFRHGQKVFLVAPLHHHFEAIGWPSYKVTMRFWILSVIAGIIGLCLAIIG